MKILLIAAILCLTACIGYEHGECIVIGKSNSLIETTFVKSRGSTIWTSKDGVYQVHNNINVTHESCSSLEGVK